MNVFDYMNFLDHSPTAWHASKEIGNRLANAGFIPLDWDELWQLEKGERYFLEKNGFLMAFALPKETPDRMVVLGSHTDSPALKLKPVGRSSQKNMLSHGIEVYGAPHLSSWLGRDLCLTGIVHYLNDQGKRDSHLVHLTELPVVIPHLAIHLDRNVNENGHKLDRQKHLCPLLTISSKETNSLDLIEKALHQEVAMKQILGWDLFFVPAEKARLVGFDQQLLASYRIDNLSSVYASLYAMVHAKYAHNILPLALFWNHEEIGSGTAEGALAPFFEDFIKVLAKMYNIEDFDYIKWKQASLCISADASHALHPNYPEKHDESSPPLLGKGIVIKYNANMRYATMGETESFIKLFCHRYHIPYQHFVSHNEMPCGSTIGPLFSHVTGIPTVDIGVPQLGMHSAREVMAVADETYLCQLLKGALEYAEL